MQYKQSPSNLLWVYPAKNDTLLEYFISEFHIHPATAQVLVSRKFTKKTDVHRFLYSKLPHLIPPEKLSEIDKATERLHIALKKGESILIFGDNDVDGITGTTLLVDFLRALGASVYFYIVSRTSDRGNTILDSMDYAKKNNCKLLITVDCGITAADEIEEFTKVGIDVIITDHHEPTDRIPHCIATLNPKLKGSKYLNKDLTGVGVAFKFAHAMMNMLAKKGEVQADLIDLRRYLDLVALGTISDMGALTGENRILVRYGIEQLRKTQRIGLLKLIHVSDVNPEDITTTDIASKVAPRLNSLGRIDNPIKGVNLLLVRDMAEAEALARDLDLMNQKRQKIERKDTENLDKVVADNPGIVRDKAIVLHSYTWHSGIIAILATKISKLYNKPTIIITIKDGIGKGSIRTIPEFPVLHILKENKDLLLNFGGHDYACGLTIKEENIPALRERFIAAAQNNLKEKDVLPKLYLDAKISFKDLTFEFLESLTLLEPYGMENPHVTLYATARQVHPPKIIGKNHLKFSLEDGDRYLEGIGFNMANRKPSLIKKNLKLLIAFTPHINIYLNKSSIQLQIKDFIVLEDD
ncbi:MAG: Single-stranded-DNA-specific exonuclease RecJ [Chlamydiia bacterium]|nr:Single-stranded-DNA-specific exonuclease RecJ [Chlamydiia bacterium]MCH9618411.1 Single-stranded-DNA-specific exonuclease RecJ [Chlamydiia bacterium]MCH9623737.1 Single-stranded-DNA-specific exonuclease RecJ [Chlamydiia bacterium]